MSSGYVRTQIKSFLAANSAETFVDMTAQYESLDDVLAAAGIDHMTNSAWVSIDFLPSDEIPVSVPAGNDQGCYRETGAVYFHIVDVAKLGVGDTLISRADALRGILRGQRIGDILIDSVTPVSTAPGSTLTFEGGWMAGSFFCSYQRDYNL